MNRLKNTKTCFVISPIGQAGTSTRLYSNQVFRHIIAPATTLCGYVSPIRSDHISEPGVITSQVFEHLLGDDLIIADLTDRNPNVFYELAIRHLTRKPVVQIIRHDQEIPFDLAPLRTIHVDLRSLDSAAVAREAIVEQIKAAELAPDDAQSPLTFALDLERLRQSTNPLEKSNAEILTMLQEIRSTLTTAQWPTWASGLEIMLIMCRRNSQGDLEPVLNGIKSGTEVVFLCSIKNVSHWSVSDVHVIIGSDNTAVLDPQNAIIDSGSPEGWRIASNRLMLDLPDLGPGEPIIVNFALAVGSPGQAVILVIANTTFPPSRAFASQPVRVDTP